MPTRWSSLVIVLFWLGMMTVLFHKEVWPLLQPDAPPPFTIDLVDEGRQQVFEIRWNVFLDGTLPTSSNLAARTSVTYEEKPDDSFSFNIELFCTTPKQRGLALGSLTLQ